MNEKEIQFNLIDEPWIKVLFPDCSEDKVSLREVFQNAHKYEDLAGELPTQDFAILRVLLAILHAVFYRVDENNVENPVTNSTEAYERWKKLWNLNAFPEEAITDYLEQWHERFWLFHPERPIWQVQEAKNGTKKQSAAKLNGEISESANTPRFFLSRTGEFKNKMTFDEAARWLFYFNGFDDTALKKSSEAKAIEKATDSKLPSIGVGWLGELGIIQIKGNNLFETLMLNLVFLDRNGQIWDDCYPIWELDEVRKEERKEYIILNDQADFLTIQSRRILLCRDGNFVNGYYIKGGDIFSKENVFIEQMTVFNKKEDKNRGTVYFPKPHERGRQIWRDFSNVIAKTSSFDNPGVIEWIAKLKKKNCIEKRKIISYRIVSTRYDSTQRSKITDVFEDSLAFHLNLLTELGRVWVNLVEKEVRFCENLAKCIYQLSKDLNLAAGGSDSGAPEKAKERYFYEIDIPFRLWLRSLDADQDDVVRNIKDTEWRDTAVQIARNLGLELVEEAGSVAYIGRTVIDNKNKKYHYSSPEAYNRFLHNIKKMGG